MFLCQHLGILPEEVVYSREKMSDPTYKPPLCFRLALRLQNGGVYVGHYGNVELMKIYAFDVILIAEFMQL